jgi:hypothetical protein
MGEKCSEGDGEGGAAGEEEGDVAKGGELGRPEEGGDEEEGEKQGSEGTTGGEAEHAGGEGVGEERPGGVGGHGSEAAGEGEVAIEAEGEALLIALDADGADHVEPELEAGGPAADHVAELVKGDDEEEKKRDEQEEPGLRRWTRALLFEELAGPGSDVRATDGAENEEEKRRGVLLHAVI